MFLESDCEEMSDSDLKEMTEIAQGIIEAAQADEAFDALVADIGEFTITDASNDSEDSSQSGGMSFLAAPQETTSVSNASIYDGESPRKQRKMEKESAAPVVHGYYPMEMSERAHALQDLINRMGDEFNQVAVAREKRPTVTYKDISDALNLPGPSGSGSSAGSKEVSPEKPTQESSVTQDSVVKQEEQVEHHSLGGAAAADPQEGHDSDSDEEPPPLGFLSESEDEQPIREWEMSWTQCPNLMEYLGEFHRSLLGMRRAQDATRAFLAAPAWQQRDILRMQARLVKHNTEALRFLQNLQKDEK